MGRRTLRGQLARTLGLTAALSVAATALISFGLVRRYAEQDALNQLSAQGRALASVLHRFGPAQTKALRRLALASGNRMAFVGPGSATASNDRIASQVASSIDTSPLLARRNVKGFLRIGGTDYAYFAAPVTEPGSFTSGLILVRRVGLARTTFRPILTRVLIAGAVAVGLAIAASAVVARRLAGPVVRVSEATARVAAGDLAHRVPVEGETEVAELARRFNAMADGLLEARRREHEFLASVSHELRTPITAILGYAEALADDVAEDPAERAKALGVIRAEAARLERLVQDVMDLARLGAGEFRLRPAEVDLAPALKDTVKACDARASEAGVTVEAAVPDKLVMFTDADRVRQVVTNLVDNALRVLQSGGKVSVTGRAESRGAVIEVADTGPGIAAADLPHVFERSYLWGVSRGVREVGTGLGLAIVRELTAALGGTIEASSEVGKGTTFRLRLTSLAPQAQR